MAWVRRSWRPPGSVCCSRSRWPRPSCLPVWRNCSPLGPKAAFPPPGLCLRYTPTQNWPIGAIDLPGAIPRREGQQTQCQEGEMGSDAVLALDAILDQHGRDPTRLLQILIAAQDLQGWLPPALITRVAAGLNLPRARVEGVAGFYSFLYRRPVGHYRVLFSDNIIDRMLGSRELMAAMAGKLWVEPGKVSEDGLVSLDATSCTGMGDQGPAILVNGLAITHLTHQRVTEICELIRRQLPLDQWPADYFTVHDNIRRADALLSCTAAPEIG